MRPRNFWIHKGLIPIFIAAATTKQKLNELFFLLLKVISYALRNDAARSLFKKLIFLDFFLRIN